MTWRNPSEGGDSIYITKRPRPCETVLDDLNNEAKSHRSHDKGAENMLAHPNQAYPSTSFSNVNATWTW